MQTTTQATTQANTQTTIDPNDLRELLERTTEETLGEAYLLLATGGKNGRIKTAKHAASTAKLNTLPNKSRKTVTDIAGDNLIEGVSAVILEGNDSIDPETKDLLLNRVWLELEPKDRTRLELLEMGAPLSDVQQTDSDRKRKLLAKVTKILAELEE